MVALGKEGVTKSRGVHEAAIFSFFSLLREMEAWVGVNRDEGACLNVIFTGKYCSFQEASTVHTAAVSPLMQSYPSPAATGSSARKRQHVCCWERGVLALVPVL